MRMMRSIGRYEIVEQIGRGGTATVYLATLEESTAEVLEERRVHLQRTVGAQMTMKRTPRLTFKADPAIAAGSRVEELLRGLHEGESPAEES